jgi:hypothetical protein
MKQKEEKIVSTVRPSKAAMLATASAVYPTHEATNRASVRSLPSSTSNQRPVPKAAPEAGLKAFRSLSPAYQ